MPCTGGVAVSGGSDLRPASGGLPGAARRLAPLAAALVLVVACSAGASRSDSRTLQVLMADDWARVGPVTDAVRDFERSHPGLRITVEGMPFAQIDDAVRMAVGSGSPPDVVQWHAFAAAAQGLAEPLDDLWSSRLNAGEYLAGALEDVTWAGRRVGVPLDTNAVVLMANGDRLAELGVDPPEAPSTFAELAEMARRVTGPEGPRRGIALAHSSWRTYGWIRANDGEVVAVDEEGRPTFSLDAPRVVEALEFLQGLVREGTAFPPVARNVSTDAFSLYRAGVVPLHVSGAWDAVDFQQASPGTRQLITPLPRGTPGAGGTALGGSSLFVPRGASQRELAFEFMLHLTSDPYALRLAREEGRLPARRRVFNDPFFQAPAFRTIVAEIETARPMRLIAYPEADQAFTDAIDTILTGEEDAAVALERAQRAAEGSAERSPG